MIRLITVIVLAATLPPSYKVDDDYTAVRNDVLAQMNAADKNLPKCEAKLDKAQDDLLRLRVHADELRAATRELGEQKRLLKAHITALETVLQRGPTYGDQFVTTWEQIDGGVGLATGYALGTAQCVGMAWVFNQPEFRR